MGKALQIRQKAADSPQGLTARRWPALLALARKAAGPYGEDVAAWLAVPEAQAEPCLDAVGVLVIKSRVLGADIAQAFFAESEYEPAQAVRLQKWAVLVFGERKMRRRRALDAPTHRVADIARECVIKCQRVLIYVYLPATAAAVPAA